MRTMQCLLLSLMVATGQSARADAVDDYIGQQLDRQHMPGLALAVIRNSKPVKVRSYGIANLELNVPVTADSVFKIGSLSKQFIATAIMLLVDADKLTLEDPIVRFLDGAPDAWRDITVRHVLSHTSGLVREGPAFDALKIQSDADVIRSAYTLPLVFRPGEKFQYCNLGYFILAEIIHKVSGQAWPAFMEKNIFSATGMHATGTTDAVRIIPNRAAGYVYRDGSYQNAVTLLALRPSGAFVSSINDLIRWDAVLHSDKVVSAKTRELMSTSVTLSDGKPANYGLGWFLEQVGSHRHVYHGGAIPGFRAQFSRFVSDGLTVIVLTNNETAATDAIAFNVAGKYIPGLVPTRKVATIAPAVLDTYVGRYDLGPSGTAVIQREGNLLVATLTANGISWHFVPESDTTFFVEDDPRMEGIFEQTGASRQPLWILQVNGIEQLRGSRVAAQ